MSPLTSPTVNRPTPGIAFQSLISSSSCPCIQRRLASLPRLCRAVAKDCLCVSMFHSAHLRSTAVPQQSQLAPLLSQSIVSNEVDIGSLPPWWSTSSHSLLFPPCILQFCVDLYVPFSALTVFQLVFYEVFCVLKVYSRSIHGEMYPMFTYFSAPSLSPLCLVLEVCPIHFSGFLTLKHRFWG